MIRRRSALAPVVLLAVACGGDDSPSDTGDSSTGGTESTSATAGTTSASTTDGPTSTTAGSGATDSDTDTDTDGPPTGDDPAVIPGDRLGAQAWDAGDGAGLFRRIWDTELGTPCSYRETDDGTLRCVPIVLDKVTYSDSGCSQPVFHETEPTCDIRFVYERSYPSSCDEPSQFTIYQVGKNTQAVADLFVVSSTGCIALGPPTGNVYDVTAMPASAFVEGSWTDEARADGITARFVDGDDDSRFLLELHGANDLPCGPDEDGNVCFPDYVDGLVTGLGELNTYVDDTCTDLGLPVFDCPADVVVLRDGIECDAAKIPHVVGASVPVEQAHFGDGTTTCDPTGIAAPFLHRVGAEITGLPPVTGQLEGTGPVKALRFWDSASAVLGPTTLLDNDGIPCRPIDVGGGTIRCVDQSTATAPSADAQPLFADDGCTMPLVRSPQCSAGTVRYATAASGLWCSDQTLDEVFEVGAAFDGTMAYELIDTSCTPVDVTGVSLLELGAAASADVFPELTLVTP